MSLDITIKVDPGNAVAQAAKVETALAKVEDQAEAIGPAVVKSAREGSTAQDKLKRNADVLARSFAGITQALDQEQKMLDKIHGPMKRAAEDAATLERLHRRGAISATEYAAALGKAANAPTGPSANPMDAVSLGAPAEAKAGKWEAKLGEMRTGVTMGVASQLLGNAGQLTDILGTMKEITGLPIGGTGTALGFMFGGPMGAAVGTAIEATGSWIKENTTLLDSVDNLTVAQSLSGTMWAESAIAVGKMRDEMARVEAAARPVMEVIGGSVAHMKMLTHQTSLFADLAGNAAEMFDRLGGVLGSAPVQKFISGMAAAMGDYKAQLDDIDGPLKKFQQGQASLDIALAAGKINAGQYTLRMGELTQAFATTDNHLSALTKQHERATAAARAQSAAVVQLGGDLDSTGRIMRNLGAGKGGGLGAAAGMGDLPDSDMLAGAGPFSSQRYEPDGPNLDADLKAHNGGKNPWDAAADKNTASIRRQQAALDALESAATMAGDALVDAFMGADVSATELLKTITSMLAKQALGQLIGAGFGALSPTAPRLGGARTGMDAMVPAGAAPFLPGFATGGDMLVGGSGGPDTKIAAFKVSPGESIHVRTPQQRDQTQRSTGGGSRTVNINVPGVRDAVTEHNLEGLVVRVVERNNPALRSRLRG